MIEKYNILSLVVLIGGVSSLSLASVGFYDTSYMANTFHLSIGVLQLLCFSLLYKRRELEGLLVGLLTYLFSSVYSFLFFFLTGSLFAIPGLSLSIIMTSIFAYYIT